MKMLFSSCFINLNELVGYFNRPGPEEDYLYSESALNPLVPDAHYSERQDKPFSLQIKQLEVNLKWNCGFLFFAPWGLMG